MSWKSATPLLERKARGIELTAAGRVFLDHARLALAQVDNCRRGGAARRPPEKASFVLGFLTGHEVIWLPEALRILRREQPGVDVTLSSQSSPELAGALMRGKVDVAFLRREAQAPGLAFKFLIKEPLVAALPSGHRLAARKSIRPQDIAGEVYITPTKAAPALKAVIDGYAARSGITLTPAYEAENLSMAMSLVASTGGVTLLPLYAENLLSPRSSRGRCRARFRPSIWCWATASRTRRPCSSASWRKPMKWPPRFGKSRR